MYNKKYTRIPYTPNISFSKESSLKLAKIAFQNSDYIRNHEWLWANFPDDVRYHSVILTADNVLEPHTIQQVLMSSKDSTFK